MKEHRIAKRYARSLLGLAEEQGVVDEVRCDMRLIAETCSRNRELGLLLKSPIIKEDKKQVILKNIFDKQIGLLSLLFIKTIVAKGREEYLQNIADEFGKQYMDFKNIITAQVTTASGIDDKLCNDLLNMVKSSVHSEVELDQKIDERIIGGLILRIGDRQIDASIARKLADLKKSFFTNN